jgi:hypothetical protein
MQHRRGSKEQLCLAVMIGVCLEAHTIPAAEPVQGAVFKVRIANRATADGVEHSLVGAARRLSDARCQSVLAEFKDAAGRTLAEKLEATGRTPQEYLGSLLFYDGSNERRCGVRGTLAVTAMPGSRVVFICGDAFLRAAFLDQQLAEVTIIHETLHTLGLGENPPTSREITSRVMSRCH